MIENEKYLRAYFGNNAGYYIKQYQAFREGNRFTFNVAPFFIGGLWFLYRKLWSETIILILLTVLVNLIRGAVYPDPEASKDEQVMFMLIVTAILGTVCGFIGNYCYLAKAEREIGKILEQTSNEDDRIFMLTQSGGISWIPFLIAGLAIVAMAVGGGQG